MAALYRLVRELLAECSDPEGDGPGVDAVLQRTLADGRVIHIRSLPWRVVEQVLLDLLTRCWQPVAPPTLYSNLRGVSRFHAFGSARVLLRDGHVFGARADISKCFASTPIALVHQALLAEVPNLHGGVVRAILRLQDSAVLRNVGRHWIQTPCPGTLLTGTPLSPALCDIVLAHVLDRRFAAACAGRCVCLRYVDDLLLLGRSEEDVAFGMAVLRHLLDPVYALHREKTSQHPVDLRTGTVNWLGKIVSVDGIETPYEVQEELLDRILNHHPDDAQMCEAAIRAALREMIFDPTETVVAFRDQLVSCDPRGSHWDGACQGWGTRRNRLIQQFGSPRLPRRARGARKGTGASRRRRAQV